MTIAYHYDKALHGKGNDMQNALMDYARMNNPFIYITIIPYIEATLSKFAYL